MKYSRIYAIAIGDARVFHLGTASLNSALYSSVILGRSARMLMAFRCTTSPRIMLMFGFAARALSTIDLMLARVPSGPVTNHLIPHC
jgi:hypothetical protein